MILIHEYFVGSKVRFLVNDVNDTSSDLSFGSLSEAEAKLFEFNRKTKHQDGLIWFDTKGRCVKLADCEIVLTYRTGNWVLDRNAQEMFNVDSFGFRVDGYDNFDGFVSKNDLVDFMNRGLVSVFADVFKENYLVPLVVYNSFYGVGWKHDNVISDLDMLRTVLVKETI
jgi:hypothetical protein